MTKLNAELQTAYLANSYACPFCESRDIEGGSTLEVDGRTAWQEITCLQCRARWNDLFTLSGIEVLDDPNRRRYQFQATGGFGDDIDICFENINRLADLNPEHEPATIMALEVGQTLTYSHGYTLVRLEDADGAAVLTIDMAKEPQPITSLWYDYTNQAWVKNAVYLTCGHDGTAPCGYALDQTPAFCYGRLHAGETPAQSIIEQYANSQGQQEAKTDIRAELAAPAVEALPLRSLSEVDRRREEFRNSVAFQFNFVLYSGLSIEKAIDHICIAAERL